MISSANYRKVRINITTYKEEESNQTEHCKMNLDSCNKRPHKNNKFVCSICLNSKNELNKMTKACPICQKNCDYCKERHRDKKEERHKTNDAKGVQTSETDLPQGLTLLNEVLTVFQNKKGEFNRVKSKTSLYRDVGVSTESKTNIKSNLTINTFQYSIDNTQKCKNGKFTIVNCSQPIFVRKSLYSVDLLKYKSSSIPQMKMEELKYSLKEKTKSKDAIEEVNRMFATVRKNDGFEHDNRPVVRNGPRVLPVVKSNYVNPTTMEESDCKCCQTNCVQEQYNFKLDCMSSGDSIKTGCKDAKKCLYMVCCHYRNSCKTHRGVMICEQCKKSEDYHCLHENCKDDDSC